MLTLSKSQGTGGTIKESPEDFVVEEITKNGIVLEAGKTYSAKDLGMPEPEPGARFTTFVMQKRDWNTTQALITVARRFRRTIRSMGFAGTKDRASISTQLCSIYGVGPDPISRFHAKDISINGAWQCSAAVKLGDLLGNRFTIKISGMERPEQVGEINKELGGMFPNYFGGQRFGTRDNNAQIGIDIMKGDFESATTRFLTDTTNETNESAIEARKRLASEHDFAAALQYFPGYLKYELFVLEHLSKVPTDYAGALRRLPRSIALMFVHSVDSYIFNEELKSRVEHGAIAPALGDLACQADAYGFPDLTKTESYVSELQDVSFIVGNMVGYDSNPNDTEIGIMEKLGITKEQFKVPNMPELNCKGARRALFAPYVGFGYNTETSSLGFSLPSGSYATILLNEFIKEKG